MNRRRLIGVWLVLLVVCGQSHAGGPLAVAGTVFNPAVDGKALAWDSTSAVSYRTPNAGNLGKLDNATASARVQTLFKVWEDVSTSNIRFQNAGPIQNVGAYQGGAVNSAAKFNAVDGSCGNGLQSPIVFDADGSLFTQLGLDADVIGFAGPCSVDLGTGHITAAEAVLNGKWIDNNRSNRELTDNQFDETFVHEFGHFIGLDHSQISVAVLGQPPDHCSVDLLAALPVMFPFAHCQARADASLPILSADDQAWISMLYPETTNDPPNKHERFDQKYGVISGKVVFSDAQSLAQGVNVLAEDSNGSNSLKFSVVSGYLFTGNPGQSVTGTNDGDGGLGSHDQSLIGTFDIPAKPGTYTLRLEPIFPEFVGGSGVGPLFPFPIAGVVANGTVTVTAGSTTAVTDIPLTNPQPRFDQFEDK